MSSRFDTLVKADARRLETARPFVGSICSRWTTLSTLPRSQYKVYHLNLEKPSTLSGPVADCCEFLDKNK